MSLHQTTPKYDVFLSFRGEDTREKFTSHLHKELCRQNIETFIDYRLERGDEINSSLVEAIKESLIYVVILSEHYASSGWCLDELTEILKCKKEYKREVIPVFYEVDPSNVRRQSKSYEKDFLKHQHRPKDKIDAWKAALTQVAGLSGWDSQVTRPESKLVTKIVKDIVKKLNRSVTCVSSDYEGMTGIDNHIENIQSLLLLELPTVRIIGIWGMGGIGKTTIASAVFEKLAPQFKSKSIIRNVQQEIKSFGLFRVKEEYLSQLLSEKITSSESNAYDQRLKRMKVLIVFDDVKDADQLKDLIGTHHKFGQGSRLIVTSRNRQVLENANAHEIYQVSGMDCQDSLKLFCSFAFKQNHPKESFVSLTEKVLDYAKGLPLALKVLGSLLYRKSEKVWESELQKLKNLPDHDIFKLLKLSYDGLDEEQKNIFLDIACFFRGEWEKVVALILDSCGFSACKGMDDLKDRGLISISKGRVWMHDLIQEMGHEIVKLQCDDDPGKRSRLWKPSDIYDVLSNNKGKGTNKIQCIFVNMWEMSAMTEIKVQLDAETFEEMHNLRMIKFYNQYWEPVTFYAFLKSFPKHLKFLCWDGFPQRSLPQDFCPKNLVILHMPHSNLEQLWEGDQALPKLKRLNLSHSKKLVRVPDLSLSPNIEEVILRGCESLIEVYSSAFLDNLNWLWLAHCSKLERLDIRSNILRRSSGLVNLDGCDKLETLLISGRTDVVQSYIYSDNCVYSNLEGYFLDWPRTAIRKNDEGDYEILECNGTVATSFNELCWLQITSCESLTCLPAELFNFKFLRRLSLSGCSKLEVLPEFKETMENLKVLILDKTAIKELPSFLHHLVGLEKLSLKGCTKLKTIPSSIGNFSKLLKLDLTYCESLETFPSSIFKLKLTELDFEGCSMLRTFPEILEPAESFTYINLTETAIKELPPSLHHLVGLENLRLERCTKLKTIPSSIGNLSKLLKLDLSYCESLETFPSSVFKLKLTKLYFDGCSMLQTFAEILEPAESFTHINLVETAIKELPPSLHHLVGLEKLRLERCTKLKTIPSSIGNLSKLLKLDLSDCESLETFPSSIFKLKLTRLDFGGCQMLGTFPEIPNDSVCLSSLTELSLQGSSIVNLHESMAHLSSLRSLNISDCKLLECVPKLPPNLNEVLAFDCPSIKRMMLNSGSDSKEGTFKLYLTKSEELDATSLSNIEKEADIKINNDAYSSVLFFFPGSAVPDWFPHRCQGHSITTRSDDLYLYERNRLIGFALCVVLGRDFPYDFFWYDFAYALKFESDGQTHFLPNKLKIKFDWWGRNFTQDHTFIWKYELDLARIGNGLIDAHTITFEILDKYGGPLSYPTTMTVKECGICPLYTKQNDDGNIEEPSGDAVCLLDLDLSLGANYTQNKRRKK